MRPNPTVTQLIDYQQFCGFAPETAEEKSMKNGIPQLSVKELKQRMDAGEDVQLIDVREPYEYQIAQIGGKLIPQSEVPNRLAEIDREREVVVHCRSGARSQKIAEFLKQAGYPRVVNLAGGILAWSDEIDPRCRNTKGEFPHWTPEALGAERWEPLYFLFSISRIWSASWVEATAAPCFVK